MLYVKGIEVDAISLRGSELSEYQLVCLNYIFAVKINEVYFFAGGFDVAKFSYRRRH